MQGAKGDGDQHRAIPLTRDICASCSGHRRVLHKAAPLHSLGLGAEGERQGHAWNGEGGSKAERDREWAQGKVSSA